MKTLVVYFSRKGYTKRVAEERAGELGADIYEIKPAERTAGILGFWWCGRFGMHRWGMPLRGDPIDVSVYDEVVFCSPVWVFSVSAPMREFMKLCAGRVKSARYILVHFSFPMKYSATVKEMDEILGVKHRSFTSVACQWGKLYRKREVEEEPASAPELK